jgi:hypothetical protein
MSRIRPYIVAIVSAAAYFIGQAISYVAANAFGLPLPNVSGQPSPFIIVAGMLALGSACVWLRSRLSVGRFGAFAILTLFLFVVKGVNNVIEAMYFTNIGGWTAMILAAAVSSAAAAAVVAFFQSGPVRMRKITWPGPFRIFIAWAAFPILYIICGLAVAPVVIPVYRDQLHQPLPELSVVLTLQLLRSVIFLVSVFPIALRWNGTRVSLAIELGGCYFLVLVVGSLLQGSNWFPAVLLVSHGIELTICFVAYAAVIAWLIGARAESQRRIESDGNQGVEALT